MKTYTLDDIQDEGWGLENGIDDLPERMKARLQKQGVEDLFPVQLASFQLFAHQ